MRGIQLAKQGETFFHSPLALTHPSPVERRHCILKSCGQQRNVLRRYLINQDQCLTFDLCQHIVFLFFHFTPHTDSHRMIIRVRLKLSPVPVERGAAREKSCLRRPAVSSHEAELSSNRDASMELTTPCRPTTSLVPHERTDWGGRRVRFFGPDAYRDQCRVDQNKGSQRSIAASKCASKFTITFVPSAVTCFTNIY